MVQLRNVSANPDRALVISQRCRMRAIEIGSTLRNVTHRGCGEGCRTLIIASIGTSLPTDPTGEEMTKARLAEQVGADVVTDHSFCGDIAALHTALSRDLKVLVSCVSCYELAAALPGERMSAIPPDAAVEMFEQQAGRGLDLITVHASFLRRHLDALRDCRRIIPTTSKGGAIVSALMRATGRENPYYEGFDRVLDICSRFHVTLSLGTSFRPGSVCDEWDELLETELECMRDLVERAHARGVGVMIEGIGHAAIDEIPRHVHVAKRMCHGAPYRVLPMATDIALGFDHISGAIAAATAVGAALMRSPASAGRSTSGCPPPRTSARRSSRPAWRPTAASWSSCGTSTATAVCRKFAGGMAAGATGPRPYTRRGRARPCRPAADGRMGRSSAACAEGTAVCSAGTPR